MTQVLPVVTGLKTGSFTTTATGDVADVAFPQGDRRLALVAVMAENAGVGAIADPTVTLDFGGPGQVSATLAHEHSVAATDTSAVWLFYVKHSQIPAGAGTVRVAFAGSLSAFRVATGVIYTGVDQGAPIGATEEADLNFAQTALSDTIMVASGSAVANLIALEAAATPSADGTQDEIDAGDTTFGWGFATESFADADSYTQGWTFTSSARQAQILVEVRAGPDAIHQQQLRGSTAAAHATFTGAAKEVTVDQTNHVLRVHDGVKAGGHVVGAAPGSRMLVQQTSAWVGWVKVTEHDDKALRVVSGTAGDGGTDDFSTIFGAAVTTDGHALSGAQTGPHTHNPGNLGLSSDDDGQTGAENSAQRGAAINGTITLASGATASGGGGSAHSHDLTLDLAFVDVVLQQKEA